MRRKTLWMVVGGILVGCAMLVMAANPSFQSFLNTQFATGGNVVTIHTNAQLPGTLNVGTFNVTNFNAVQGTMTVASNVFVTNGMAVVSGGLGVGTGVIPANGIHDASIATVDGLLTANAAVNLNGNSGSTTVNGNISLVPVPVDTGLDILYESGQAGSHVQAIATNGSGAGTFLKFDGVTFSWAIPPGSGVTPTFNVNQFGNGSGADGSNILSGAIVSNLVHSGTMIFTNKNPSSVSNGPGIYLTAQAGTNGVVYNDSINQGDANNPPNEIHRRGWNTDQNGHAVNTNYPVLSEEMEQYWSSAGTHFSEWHQKEGGTTNGVAWERRFSTIQATTDQASGNYGNVAIGWDFDKISYGPSTFNPGMQWNWNTGSTNWSLNINNGSTFFDVGDTFHKSPTFLSFIDPQAVTMNAISANLANGTANNDLQLGQNNDWRSLVVGMRLRFGNNQGIGDTGSFTSNPKFLMLVNGGLNIGQNTDPGTGIGHATNFFSADGHPGFKGDGGGLTNVTANAPTDGSLLTNVTSSTFLSLQGQVLFNPAIDGSSSGGTSTMRQSGAGVVLDSGAANGSAWAPFGSNMSLVVLDWTGMGTTNWDPVAGDAPHIGPVAQYTDGNHFRGFVGLDILTSSLHYADREGGSEIAQLLVVTNTVLQMNHPYRLLLSITNTGVAANTNVNVQMFDGVTGLLITNKIFQESFFGTNGYQCIHTFGAAGVTLTNAVFAGDGVTLVSGGPQEWIAVNNASGSAFSDTISGGVITATNSTSYKFDLAPVVMKDGEFSGVLNFNNANGRPGVVARMSTAGFGYLFWYDGNNAQIRAGTLDNAGNYTQLAVASATSPALTLNTNLPFYLNLRGPLMSFSIGNNTLVLTDYTYLGAGYVGVMTRETTASWSKLKVFNSIGDGNIPSSHLSGGGVSPTIVTNAGAGGGTGTVTLDATAGDAAGTITLNTGTLPTSSATVLTLTFANAYDAAPHVVFCPANNNAAALNGVTMVFIDTVATGSFTMKSGGTGLAGATTYKWNYHVIR